MRRTLLYRSIQRLLGCDEKLHDAAVMWSRHRLMVPYLVVVALILGVGATVVGFSVPSAVAIAAAGTALGAAATTEHRVLAATEGGLWLLRSSRIRTVAVEVLEQMPSQTTVELVANQFVLTEWIVGDRRFTVPKSSEAAMTRIAMSRL